MSLHIGHRERVRQKILKNGFDNLPTHEVLEYILFFTIPRGDTNYIAHNLIKEFGSLKNVFNAPIDELKKINGVGEQSAHLLSSMLKIFRYCENENNSDKFLLNTKAVFEYFKPQYIGRTVETLILVALDTKCKVLVNVIMGEGNVNTTVVNNRKIVEIGLKYNASAMIIAHNHPGGLAIPSREDIITTNNIFKILEAVNIHLIDHIIIADNQCASIRDMKLAPNIF